MVQSARALQWIMDNLRPAGFRPTDAPSLNLIPAEDCTDGLTKPVEREESRHVKARQLHYPDSKVTRFPVPEEKVPWEVNFSSYNPPYYSSPDTADKSEPGSDTSKNPGGRTGLRGRGVLPRLGPNCSLDLILTRWRDRACSELEFLVFKDENKKCLILPGGEVDSAEDLPQNLEKTLGNKACQKIRKVLKDKDQMVELYKGYVDDSRNTDDAWVETTVLHLHLARDCPLLADINNKSEHSVESLEWQEVSGRTRLGSDQKDFLKIVAQLHSSKF